MAGAVGPQPGRFHPNRSAKLSTFSKALTSYLTGDVKNCHSTTIQYVDTPWAVRDKYGADHFQKIPFKRCSRCCRTIMAVYREVDLLSTDTELSFLSRNGLQHMVETFLILFRVSIYRYLTDGKLHHFGVLFMPDSSYIEKRLTWARIHISLG